MLRFKNKFFYLFLIIYFFIGIYASLTIGITFDEPHSNWVWESNKNKISNVFFNKNFDINYLESTYHGFYGIGFYLVSFPLELVFSKLINNINISSEGSILLLKHPTVFIFLFISGIFYRKIIQLATNSETFSNLSTIFFLTYPYVLGHSFFNIKDIPFMSVWLISTFYLIKILNEFFFRSKIRYKNLFIFSLLTAYLFSLRINGILIFLEYSIFLIVYLNVFKIGFLSFIKKTSKEIVFFFVILFAFVYLMYPIFWSNPAKFIESIIFFSKIIQTVCTVTLGECMKAQSLPSNYLLIWLFFKLPLLILFGLILFPFIEKKIFTDKKNYLILGSLSLSVVSIILFLALLKINLYDEIRIILFLIPLIFIISTLVLFNFKKKLSIFLLSFYILFFTINNFNIFPYNYLWLNNFNIFINVNKNFEKDYWGASTKEIAKYFNKNNLNDNTCIISNRNDGIKYFLNNESSCFKPFSDLHKKNKRPFYVVLTERSLKKGVPNKCDMIHSETSRINFSKEDIVLAKIYKCN